jgi:diaminopropionate ammonia-lyase
MDIWFNSAIEHPLQLPANLAMRVGAFAPSGPLELLQQCPAYQSTPLLSLPALARDLKVEAIFWKDESSRLSLNSFKALGGGYAVFHILDQLMRSRLGRKPDRHDWAGIERDRLVRSLSIVAATAGNHGLSVAAAARVIGARCIIYVHENVSARRRVRLEAAGAEVRISPGNFEDSVQAAQEAAASEGHTLISDTSYFVDEPVTGSVVQGYSVLAQEIVAQLPANAPPSHVFVQAGVGGLAAAVAGFLGSYYGSDRPYVTVVEPEFATALISSMKAGHSVRSSSPNLTDMDMLDCYEPSALPLDVLSRAADAFMTITDEEAANAVGLLSSPMAGDPVIAATPTSSAGLAALVKVLGDPKVCSEVGLDPASRIVLIGSEGAPRNGENSGDLE